MNTRWQMTRRAFTAGAAAASTPFWLGGRAPRAQGTTEIVHWSWLAASDGEVWGKMIDAFNEAHKGKGVQIRMELVPEEQYVTKVLAASVTGKAPDFGWGTAGVRAKMAKDGVIVPLDELIKHRRPRPGRFQPVFGPVVALPEIRQPDVHGADGPDEPAARGQSRPRQGGRPRPGEVPRGRQDAARVGAGDDQARGRQGRALGDHDDRLGRAADRDLGHRRGADGLPARLGRPQERRRESRGRRRGHGLGARSVRQAQGQHPRRHRPLQGVRHRRGLDLLDRPLDAERLRRSRSSTSPPTCSPRSATSG